MQQWHVITFALILGLPRVLVTSLRTSLPCESHERSGGVHTCSHFERRALVAINQLVRTDGLVGLSMEVVAKA